MRKQKITKEDLKEMRGTVSILQGVFKPSFFDTFKKRKPQRVFVLEGRPSLEAAKISSRELLKRKITPVIISDNMAGFLFYKNLVKEVWLSVHAVDRVGAICDIGALILSVLGKEHDIPVYAYFSLKRKMKFVESAKEVNYFSGVRVTPRNVQAYVPVKDWVPLRHIKEIYDE